MTNIGGPIPTRFPESNSEIAATVRLCVIAGIPLCGELFGHDAREVVRVAQRN